MVTPHSYATCGYAGYATVTPDTVTPHGYATCGHVGYATVTPNTVTPHGYATCGYAAKHGYAAWLCHMWLRRLRQIRLRHMVTPHAQGVKNYVKI